MPTNSSTDLWAGRRSLARISTRMSWRSHQNSARKCAWLSAKGTTGGSMARCSELRKNIDLLTHTGHGLADTGAQHCDPDLITDGQPIRALQRVPDPSQLLERRRAEQQHELLDRRRQCSCESVTTDDGVVVEQAHGMAEDLMRADSVLGVGREQIVQIDRQRRIFLGR